MIETDEYQSLRELYYKLRPDDAIGYRAWLKKLQRLTAGNLRTVNATKRRLGIEIPNDPVGQKVTGTQFVAFDGEGYDDKYVLLANSLGEHISNPEGLSTKECLEFLASKYSIPTKRIFFSFSYDVNHILRDVPDDLILTLLNGKIIEWEGYKLKYIPSKIFSVNGFTYYDVFSFFATSFINVVDLMLGKDAISEKLLEGKNARGSFETWNLAKLIEYNSEELTLLVQIMEKLRRAFNDVDIYITDWYGPGAVAKYWLKSHKVKPPVIDNFDAVDALNKAYYGGRFEQVSLGKFEHIHEYDVHSAYPSVMADMPYFTDWKHVNKFDNQKYSIWRVTFDFREDAINGGISLTYLPLPMRSRDGRICFPLVGKGWYWYSEIRLVLDFFPNAKLTFHEGFVATGKDKPFSWIKSLYDYRRELKANGNLSQYAIKVGLNSLYGKTAQRVGSNDFFDLAWAGYITSSTRAKLARAGYENDPTCIIGFATDAIFSTKLLNLPISDEIGEWEEQNFDSGTFFQSGVYRLQNEGQEPIDRYRGSPLRHGISDIIEQLQRYPNQYPAVKIGRFISHLLAIKAKEAYGPYRLQFINVLHRLAFDAPYKRHYVGFYEGIKFGKDIVVDYSRIISKPITSLPKIWVEDTNPFQWNEYLNNHLTFQNIESYSSPLKDTVTQRLLEDAAVIATFDSDFEGIDDLSLLPVVEDTDEL